MYLKTSLANAPRSVRIPSLIVLISILLIVTLTGCGSGTKITSSSLTISPSVASVGQTVTVGVNIFNGGSNTITGYTLTFSVNNVYIETKNVKLNPNETATFNFEYIPAASGSYSVSINEQSGTFTVIKPASFKVGELNITPASPELGQEITVSSIITNEGERAGTYTAIIKANGNTIKTEDISVEAGQTATISGTFTPDASGTQIIELGSVTATITVSRPTEFEATSISVYPGTVLLGESTTASAEITNTGESRGELPVALIVSGVEKDSKTITLDAGASTSVDFGFTPSSAGKLDITILSSSTTLNVVRTSEYSNKKYYYSISYPQDFSVEEVDLTSTLIGNEDGFISVLVDSVSVETTPQGYFEGVAIVKKQEIPDWAYTSRTDITENGVVIGYKYDYTNTVDGTKRIGKGMMLKKGGLGFYVVFTAKEQAWDQYEEMAPLILDTFKLPVITTGEYSNIVNGIAITLIGEWFAIDTDASGSTVLLFNSDTNITSMIQKESVAEETTVKEYVDDFADFATESGWKTINNQQFIFNNDMTGHEATFTGTTTQGDTVKLRFIATNQRGRMYYVYFLGLESEIDAEAASVAKIVKSLVISAPGIPGVDMANTLLIQGGEIPTLDPAKVEDAPNGIVGAVFSGLVRIDSNLNIVPDLAESWSTSEDGTVYTFYLHQNAKFHRGKQVTAGDIKYSWERACDPATDTRKSGIFLNDIVGAADMMNGTADGISGIKVIDDYTLEVTINTGIQYFLHKIAQPVAFVVNKDNVAEGDTWYESPDGTGPFYLKSWEKDSMLILERFEDFYEGPVPLKNVVVRLYAGYPLTLYENNEIDLTSVSTANQDRVLNPDDPLNKDLLTGTAADMSYIAFNVNEPPFDDVKVREAFAAALDVDTLLEVSLKNRALRAAGYIPDQVPGFNSSLSPITFDLVRAKQLIAESKYGSVANLPPIKYHALYGTSDVDEAIIGMWQALGAKVSVETVSEIQTWYDRVHAYEFQVWQTGWRADYLDPQNFLEVLFQSDSPENCFNYSNAQVDELLTLAGIESDPEARLQQYRDIEIQILQDLPAIPIFRNTNILALAKPWVKGYKVLPIGVGQWRDIYIVAPSR